MWHEVESQGVIVRVIKFECHKQLSQSCLRK